MTRADMKDLKAPKVVTKVQLVSWTRFGTRSYEKQTDQAAEPWEMAALGVLADDTQNAEIDLTARVSVADWVKMTTGQQVCHSAAYKSPLLGVNDGASLSDATIDRLSGFVNRMAPSRFDAAEVIKAMASLQNFSHALEVLEPLVSHNPALSAHTANDVSKYRGFCELTQLHGLAMVLYARSAQSLAAVRRAGDNPATFKGLRVHSEPWWTRCLLFQLELSLSEDLISSFVAADLIVIKGGIVTSVAVM